MTLFATFLLGAAFGAIVVGIAAAVDRGER